MAHGLSCSTACGIFPDQGSDPCPPALAGGFLTTVPPGKSLMMFFFYERAHTEPATVLSALPVV